MRLLAFLSIAFSVALVGELSLAQELNPKTCQNLLKELDSDRQALWRSIPWETSLLSAQKMAVEESKPIFIWAMDGHPLGCT